MGLFYTILAAAGIPSALFSLLLWFFKRDIEKRDKAKEEKDNNIEELMLMNMEITRANYVLATATAKAVQRIPDAKCNGDMTEALKQASQIQLQEKDFLINQGIKHIFDNK